MSFLAPDQKKAHVNEFLTSLETQLLQKELELAANEVNPHFDESALEALRQEIDTFKRAIENVASKFKPKTTKAPAK